MCTDLGFPRVRLQSFLCKPSPRKRCTSPVLRRCWPGRRGEHPSFPELPRGPGVPRGAGRVWGDFRDPGFFGKDKAAVCLKKKKCRKKFWVLGFVFNPLLPSPSPMGSVSSESASSRGRPETWEIGAGPGRSKTVSLLMFSVTVTHKAEILYESRKAKKRPFTALPSYSFFLAVIWHFLFCSHQLSHRIPLPQPAPPPDFLNFSYYLLQECGRFPFKISRGWLSL